MVFYLHGANGQLLSLSHAKRSRLSEPGPRGLQQTITNMPVSRAEQVRCYKFHLRTQSLMSLLCVCVSVCGYLCGLGGREGFMEFRGFIG